jgi:hypothetical protein
MKNQLKINIVLLGLIGVLSSGISFAAAPTVSIDFPSQNQVMSGIVSVNGWAAGSTQVDTVVLYVDGKYYGDVGYGGSRNDVKNAMPGVANAGLSGFAVALNTRLMKNGSHTLEIKAFNTNNEVTTQSVTVSVSNAPGTENPTSVSLDMSVAKARVLSANKMVIEGAKVNGKSESLVLDFNAGTNNFVISSFAHDTNGDGVPDVTGCPNDRDCDGVPDAQDALPDNSHETSDTNHTGQGDNTENDHNGTNTQTGGTDTHTGGTDTRTGGTDTRTANSTRIRPPSPRTLGH